MSSVGCRLLLAKGWRVTVSGGRATDLVALFEEYLRTLNEHDLDAWAELLDPEIEIEIDSLTLHGVDAVLRFAKQIEQTFPGIVSEIVRVVATSGDAVVCEARPVNPNTDQDDQDAWYLEGVSCMIFEFREGRVARLRNYYAPSPNDRTAQSN